MNYAKELEQQNEQLQRKLAESERFHEWRDKHRATRLQFAYAYKTIIDGRGLLQCLITQHQAKRLFLTFSFDPNNRKQRINVVRAHGEVLERDFEDRCIEFDHIQSITIEIIAVGGRDGREFTSRYVQLYHR